MLGMFGLIKQELDKVGKLPDKYKDRENLIYDGEGNLSTESAFSNNSSGEAFYYLMQPLTETASAFDTTKNLEFYAKFQVGEEITPDDSFGLRLFTANQGLSAAIHGGSQSGKFVIKSRHGKDASTIQVNTEIEYAGKSVWFKLAYDASTSKWSSYYVLSKDEPTSWTKQYTFSTSQVKNIGCLAIFMENAVVVPKSSIKVIQDGKVLFG